MAGVLDRLLAGAILAVAPSLTSADGGGAAWGVHGAVAPSQHSVQGVALPGGWFVRFEGEGDGAEVALTVRGPDGAVLAAASTLLFPQGATSFALVTGLGGEHRIEVRLLPGGWDGRYGLRLVEARPAAANDGRRVEAERAYREAETLRIEGTAAALARARERFTVAADLARAGDMADLVADAETGLARLLDLNGRKAEALDAYRGVLVRHRALGRTRAVANVLNYLALVHEHLGRKEPALAALEEALAASRAIGDRRVEGLTLGNLGVVHLVSDRPRALALYQQALPVDRAAGNPRAVATILGNIGMVYDLMGNREQALAYMHQALPVREAMDEPRDLGALLNNIGALHRNADEVALAVEYFTRALVQWRRGGTSDGEPATLHNLASVHEAAGEYEPALRLYSEALPMFRANAARVREANCLTSLGRLYGTLGDHRQAARLLEDALTVHRAVGNKAFAAATLASLADLASGQSDHARARALLEEAVDLARAGRDPLREAHAVLALGRAHAGRGAHGEALAAYARAAETYRRIPRPSGEASAGVHAAASRLALGEHEAGLQEAARSLAAFRALHDRPGAAFALYTVARLELARGDLDAAQLRGEEALSAVEALRARIASHQLRSSYLATVQSYYELLVEILMRQHERAPEKGHDAAAFAVAERGRARSLLDILTEARSGIRVSVDPEAADEQLRLRRTLNAKAARHARLLGEGPASADLATLAREIDDLTRRLVRAEGEARARSPRQAGLTEPEPAGLPAVRRLLDPDTVLVEYALGESRSFVWAVTADGASVHALPSRAEVEAAARHFVAGLRAEGPEGRGPAIELGRMLLGPLGALRRRVVVVGDGALLTVPFAALVAPASGRALVEDHVLVYLPSASTLAVLRRNAAPSTADRAVAVLADPVFDSLDPRVRAIRARVSTVPAHPVRREGLARLLGSRREARAILAVSPAGASWSALDFEASREAALGPLLPHFRIVHFATHGVFDDTRPELSGIVLSLVDAHGAARDGFLRLHDVFNLRLGADLVVLSACQTALGQELRGEGLVGLTRGFMHAGARRVVATLWKVDDRATTELMRRFYAAMLGPRKLPAEDALREAQAALARETRWRSPVYWAGFVLQGDWR